MMKAWQMTLLAQQDFGNGEAAGTAGGVLFMIIYLALIIVAIAGMWKCFTKAGKPGWAAIIPIYNFVVILEIAGKPIWWILLLFIPCVNIIIALLVFIDFAKAYGQGAGFGIGLWLLGFIFFPILGFGEARYIGPPK